MHRPIWRSANGHYKSKLQMFEELDERIKKLEENCLESYVDRCLAELIFRDDYVARVKRLKWELATSKDKVED
jgi:hypothetical protein